MKLQNIKIICVGMTWLSIDLKENIKISRAGQMKV
jgi:hypothetical protein